MASGVRKLLLIDPVEHLKEYSNRLDNEMQKILRNHSISESDKLKQYLVVLRRYILSKHTGESADWGVTHLTKKEPKEEKAEEQHEQEETEEQVIPPASDILVTQSATNTDGNDATAAAEYESVNLPNVYNFETLAKKFAANKEKQKRAVHILLMMDGQNSQLKYSKTSGELIKVNNKPGHVDEKIIGSNVYKSLRHLLNTDIRSKGPRPTGH